MNENEIERRENKNHVPAPKFDTLYRFFEKKLTERGTLLCAGYIKIFLG
jgi:hypothetical protein